MVPIQNVEVPHTDGIIDGKEESSVSLYERVDIGYTQLDAALRDSRRAYGKVQK